MNRPVVINTRPADQAADLSALLREAGYEPIELPAIEIVPAWDTNELERVRLDLQRRAYSWLVLQSSNAATGLPLDDVAILCGAATAQHLRLEAAETLDHFSGRAALALLQPLVRPAERVLVPRAADGLNELVDGLRELGCQVDAPIAYRTQPTPPPTLEPLRQLTVHAITFCSPSAVDAIVRALGTQPLRQPRIVCLGQTTATAAREHGLRIDAVAQHTSMSSLVSAVTEALGVAV